MTRLLLIFLFIFGVNVAQAGISITSCDGAYAAKINASGVLVIKHGPHTVNSARIDHEISGGTFSLDNSLLVVYGFPTKIDRAYPQVTHLSLYAVGEHKRALMKESYGGGVYGVAFSTGQHFVSVDNQYGVDILNVGTKTSQSFDPTYVVGFTTQQCAVKSKQ